MIVIDKPVLWKSPTDNPYRGILKVRLSQVINTEKNLGFRCATKYNANSSSITIENWRETNISSLQVNGNSLENRINFFLLRTCALLQEQGKATRLAFAYSDKAEKNNHMCNHKDGERGFVTTATDIELNYALARFYRVTHLYT